MVEIASQEEEAPFETPVPVTVITGAMIRAIGARNLQDVLTTYVPGMSFVVDHNELNVAMHGIYASSQQKILMLLNGHRLNSRAYSMANPDYAISIPFDKIKQIEVMRGPGSSLYGNIALTAVVNVVTNPGEALNGISLQVGGGSFISGYSDDMGPGDDWFTAGKALNAVYGTGLGPGHDLLLWGSLFKAEGQRIRIPMEKDYSTTPIDAYAILGGHDDPPSYDLGLRYRYRHLSLQAVTRFGKHTEPFSASGSPTGAAYDYDKYRTLWGIKPGLGSRSDHLELAYDRALGASWQLRLAAYYDRNDLMAVLVSDPATGKSIYLDWHDDDVGIITQARYRYLLPVLGQGNLMFGLQIDKMRLVDSALPSTDGFDWTAFNDTQERPVLQPGAETIYSGFFQVKQDLPGDLTLNLGLRYDYKERHRGEPIYDLSPRIALIWSLGKLFNLKASYARSFVDAPYWYRYNSLPSYQGSQGLTPEHLQSVQLTPTMTLLNGRLVNTLNLFYNNVYDFVFRDSQAGPDDPKYRNAGKLESLGVEEELALLQELYQVRANVTFQYAVDSQDFGATGELIHNVPQWMANLIVDFNPLGRLYRKLWIDVNARFVSERLSPIHSYRYNLDTDTVDKVDDMDHKDEAYLLWNLGLRFTDLGLAGLLLDATIYNLFDQRVSQGGSVVHPYPQPGRFFMVYLTYRLPLQAS